MFWYVGVAAPLLYFGFLIYDATHIPLTSPGADYGLKELSPGVDPAVDIILVHGLDGHWKDTWTAENGVFWPQDLLPEKVQDARILSYGYDSRTHGSTPVSTQYIYDHARALVTELVFVRERTSSIERPIIFVAYSLGGLLVKSALIHSDAAREGRLEGQKSIKLSTYGIIFLGTPHQGGEGVTLGKILTQLGQLVTYTSANVIKHLAMHSEWLQQQQMQYAMISDDFDTVCFYETYRMHVPGFGNIEVVPRYSAVLSTVSDHMEEVPIAADHKSMAKYLSSDDGNFLKLVQRIERLAARAKEKTNINWERWESIKVTHGNTDGSRRSSTAKSFRIPGTLPQSRNTIFTGRDDILSKTHEILFPSVGTNSVDIAILYGPGGIGKTQVALEYAYRHQEVQGTAFWIDGTSLETVQRSISNIKTLIVLHYEEIGIKEMARLHISTDDLSPAEGFKKWLSIENNNDWLLVFDNVDDPQVYDIRSFVPATSRGKVLVTSRRSDIAFSPNGISVYEMNENEALELLFATSGVRIGENTTEYANAREIVAQLGYMPLAISQAGAYLYVRKLSNPMERYLEIYRKSARALLAEKPSSLAWNYRNDSVFTTWEISFFSLRKEAPFAARILIMCGFLSNEHLWEELFHSGLRLPNEDLSVTEAVYKLTAYSFIKPDLDDGFTIHPLIHWWLKERLPKKQRWQTTADTVPFLYSAMRSVLAEEGHAEYHHTLALKHHLAAHLEEVEENCRAYLLGNDSISIQNYPQSSHLTYANLECILMKFWGLYDDAKDYILQQWMGRSDRDLPFWLLLYRMGRIYRDTDMNEKEENLYRWILQKTWSCYPRKHPRSLSVIGDLGLTLLNQRKHDDALPWFKWLLDARQCVLGKSHPATMGALMSIGTIKVAAGDGDEALQNFKTAFDARKKLLGINDILTQNALELLAWEMGRKGDPQSLDLYLSLLRIQENVMPPEHSRLLRTKRETAMTLLKYERLQEALQTVGDMDGDRRRSWGAFREVSLLAIRHACNSGSLEMAKNFWEQWHSAASGGDDYYLCNGYEAQLLTSAQLCLIRLYGDSGEIEKALGYYQYLALVLDNRPFDVEETQCEFYEEIAAGFNDLIDTGEMAGDVQGTLSDLIDYRNGLFQGQEWNDWFTTILIMLKGRSLREQGLYNEALTEYWTSLQRVHPCGEYPTQYLNRETVWTQIAYTLRMAGRFHEAIHIFIHIRKTYHDATTRIKDDCNIALLHWLDHQYEKSFRWLERVLQNLIEDPDIVSFIQSMIRLFAWINDTCITTSLIELLADARIDIGFICPVIEPFSPAISPSGSSSFYKFKEDITEMIPELFF